MTIRSLFAVVQRWNRNNKLVRRLLPLLIIALLLIGLWLGLRHHNRPVEGGAVIATAPNITLPVLANRDGIPQKPVENTAVKISGDFSLESVRGQVAIVNFFASWCATCELEHPNLLTIHKELPDVVIIGVAYRDTGDRIASYLARLGNPYSTVVLDSHGQGGIALGAVNVPETFVISRNGVIEYRLKGPITLGHLQGKIMPLLIALQKDKAS